MGSQAWHVGCCSRCQSMKVLAGDGLCHGCGGIVGRLCRDADASAVKLPLNEKWRAANMLFMEAQVEASRAAEASRGASGMGEEYERAKRHELQTLVALGRAAQVMLPLWSVAECDARHREQERADRLEAARDRLSAVPS